MLDGQSTMPRTARVYADRSNFDRIGDTIDSTARIGESVSRRRFQRGSVYKNKSGTMWLGSYADYVVDRHGVEKRIRHQVPLCPVRFGEKITGKREAQRLLQPFVDRVNCSLAAPTRERKSITLEDFLQIWRRDYLSLSKPSTQSATRSQLNRLVAAFGSHDMRRIDSGDIQRLVSDMVEEGLSPKTIRNMWSTVNLVWDAALQQKYVDTVLPKPKLPRNARKKARCLNLKDIAKVIAVSSGEQKLFYWLLAETGLRSGELAGLKLEDLNGAGLTVGRSVWHGADQTPKTDNSMRKLGLSPQLVCLLWDQVAQQKAKGHQYLFSSLTGTPRDMDVFRERKLHPLLKSLEIPSAGFHAFRHFNAALMDALRVPLKTIQERMGHALTGSFTLDVYGGTPEWEPNLEAALKVGATIEDAVRNHQQENSALDLLNSVGLIAVSGGSEQELLC